MNPESPKREAVISLDKENIKAQRVDEDQPKTELPSHKQISTAESEITDDKGNISCSDHIYDSFSDTDDENDNDSSNSFVFKGLPLPDVEVDVSRYEDSENLKKYIVGGRMDIKQAMIDGMKAIALLKREPPGVLECSEIAEYALEHFRTQMMGGDYEYVKTWSSIPVADVYYGVHTNFFARLKGTDSTPELFFAALKNGDPMEVVECCILNPRPFSLGETPPDKDVVVYHSESVPCTYCNLKIDNIDQHKLLCVL